MEMEEEGTTTVAMGKTYPEPEAKYEQLVESSQFFLEKLCNFHSSFHSHFSTPSFNGTPLDLHRLFLEVTSRGGLDQVIKDRKWEAVVSSLKFEISGVRRSFLLRKYYMALLYHFEQAYLFRKTEAPVVATDSTSQNAVVGSLAANSNDEDSTFKVSFQESLQIEPGISLVGVIDEKFDNGYVVSVNVGSDQLRGILYHIPDHPQPSRTDNLGMPQRRKRKKSRLSLLDPSKLKPSSNNGNFFTDKYASVKSLSKNPEDWASAD